ncbi:MAG: flagellar biosynthetic protein FliO [Gemmataceae bacterium]|nr:flagellar biosynthetic protein FliO [Gemmataceae bacterium]
MSLRACALLLALLVAAPARAEDAEGYEPPAWPAEPTAGDLTVRLGLLTAITVGVALAVAWWARRLPAPATAGETGAVLMKVVEAVSLGGGCSLHLLQVEEAHYVVGLDRGGLKAIQPLSKPFDQFLAQIESQAEAAPLPRPATPRLSG